MFDHKWLLQEKQIIEFRNEGIYFLHTVTLHIEWYNIAIRGFPLLFAWLGLSRWWYW